MKYLKIQNNSLLDIRLVALMGGTTKEGNKYKIGQFGTGLKYAFAYLFRNNVDFKIFIGKNEVRLHTETEEINGIDFEIICINDQRTSITTKMGQDWQAWMIIREIWCNALDEGGASKEVTTDVEGEEDKTTFYIQLTREFQEVLDQWQKFFIHGTSPIYETSQFALYPAGQKMVIYKQGILIKESSSDSKPLFSYDIKDADINELREFRGAISQQIANCFAQLKDVSVIRYILENINENTYEADVDLNWFLKWSPEWKLALGPRKIVHAEHVEMAAKKGITLDLSQITIVSKNLFKILTSQFEDISAVILAKGSSGEFFEYKDEKCEVNVAYAISLLHDCGYTISPDLTIVYGTFESRDIMARVNIREKKIYISNIHANKSIFEIMTTLIEENEHYSTGLDDTTRGFQQHFINLYTKELTKHLNL